MEFEWYGPQPRRYREPVEILEARGSGEVIPMLRRADGALAEGYSIAGYLRYDAAAAWCDLCLPVNIDAPTQALVALGVYRGPESIEPAEISGWDVGPLVAQIDRDRYERDLAQIEVALHEGDVYQVNYTVPFAFTFSGDARSFADALRRRAKVPYAALVRHGARTMISLSPELFLAIDGDRVRSKPMKGTSAPDRTSALSSRKNSAEHVMIVDLLRNDLHRLCDDVRVEALASVERYPTFAALTSTIAGDVRAGLGFAEIFGALFPCGSITGAPKLSAMKHIGRLEHASRSIAMGTIGYCDAPRRGQWNVAIRTAEIDDVRGFGTLRIGGGIVADSQARAEWAEILVKRRAFDLGEPVGLFETMRVDAVGTIAHVERHLARIEHSAFAFGIPFNACKIREAVESAHNDTRARDAIVRLELSPSGDVSIDRRELEAIPPAPVACVVPIRLQENDPALRHKTTRRAAYQNALRFARDIGAFEGILLNAAGRVADGARSTVFVRESGGRLATPPLADGALAGVLRAGLLDRGEAYERPLTLDDLLDLPVFIGNAVYGLVSISVTRLAN